MWNAPGSVVSLDSPGVVIWNTKHVPDDVGLRARNDDAVPTRVLPGRAKDSVWILITEDSVAPWGFHDVTLWVVHPDLPSPRRSLAHYGDSDPSP